jgi:hypothetical protein
MALGALHDVIAVDGLDLPNGRGFPSSPTRGARVDEWQRECDRRGLSASAELESQKRAFRNARQALKEKHVIAECDGFVWVLRRGEEAGKQ